MLTHFPTPYPGEWLYSVFCRYHVRSGYAQCRTTIRELFSDRPNTAVGSLYPNSALFQAAAQLPGHFNVRTLILRHTLFLFHTRCFPIDKKETLLARLCAGEKTTLGGTYHSKQLPAPRYCPLCAQQDRETHGEAYWHIVHQIPAIEVCPKHECRLLSIDEIDAVKVKYAFFPLEISLPPLKDTPMACGPSPWQIRLSKILYEYATLPLSYAATPGYNNLATVLGDMGYEVLQGYSPHTVLDAKRLYHDLTECFGQEAVRKVFGGEKAIRQLNRICRWECLTPERYALLQCFAGIESTTVFSQTRQLSLREGTLRRLRHSGKVFEKKQLCADMGITASQLDSLVRRYAIASFWTSDMPEQQRPQYEVKVVFNDIEHEQFKQALARSGFRFDRHFAHHCVMEYLKQYKED